MEKSKCSNSPEVAVAVAVALALDMSMFISGMGEYCKSVVTEVGKPGKLRWEGIILQRPFALLTKATTNATARTILSTTLALRNANSSASNDWLGFAARVQVGEAEGMLANACELVVGGVLTGLRDGSWLGFQSA